MSDVYMDVEAVQAMAQKFWGLKERADQISKAVEVAIVTLKGAAMLGLVAAEAEAAYLEEIKPKLDKKADNLAELAGDLESAVRAYQHGDALGATRFH